MPDTAATPDLYAGPDLEHAYEESVARSAVARTDSSRPRSWTAAAWAARSALLHVRRKVSSLATTSCYEVQGLGRPINSTDDVRVRYVGERKNIGFLVSACFSEFKVSSERALGPLEAAAAVRRAGQDEDMLLVDAESPLMSPGVPALRLPPWVRQRVSLPTSWPDFVSSLSRGTRREIARCLRKYRYQARVADSHAAFERFYRDLYQPHVVRRFGAEAFVIDEATFHRERAGTQLIELVHDGEVVAGNVVRSAGDTTWILWCGFSSLVDSRGLKGVTDVLDYFSLLDAARRGIKQVDFGRSRPRLNDGPLTYKSKWNSEVRLGVLKKPPLLIVPRNLGAPVAKSLARNQWVTRVGGSLVVVVLFDQGPVSEDDVRLACQRYRHPGISRLRLCAAQGFGFRVKTSAWSSEGIDLVDLDAARDPVRRYLGE